MATLKYLCPRMLGTYYLPYVNQNAELTLAGTRNLQHPEKSPALSSLRPCRKTQERR